MFTILRPAGAAEHFVFTSIQFLHCCKCCLSSLFLKESTLGAFTTYSGRKLHMFYRSVWEALFS